MRIIEWLNAASMLPGYYYIYLNAFQTDSAPSALKKLACYTYGLTCFSSINFHIYRAFYGTTITGAGDQTRHLALLRCDFWTQSFCIFINSLIVPLGAIGSLWAIAGAILEYYVTQERYSRFIWARHLNFATILTALTYHEMPVFILFVKAFLFFVSGKINPIFHVGFHQYINLAMAKLWAGSGNSGANAVVPETTLIAAAFFILIYYLSHANGRKWKYVDRIISSTGYCALNALVYFAEHDAAKVFTLAAMPSPLQRFLIHSELGYYIAYGAIEFHEQNWAMVAHHIFALGLIYKTYSIGYIHWACQTLFQFSISNPPLAIAKWARHSGRPKIASASFITFAALYFLFRICGMLVYIYNTLVRGFYLEDISSTTYITMNSVILLIYALQWHWFMRITRILREVQR